MLLFIMGEFMNKIKDIEIYKDMMCPFCEHYNSSFEGCEIRKCVDGTIKCCEYERNREVGENNS